jgi:NADH-quinone oxidoreductase subunit G
VLILGADLAQQHPFLSWQIRANWRHHGSAIYVATPSSVREDKYARQLCRFASGDEFAAIESFRAGLETERNLVIVFGDVIRGAAVHRLVSFGDSLGIPVKYVCLVDDCNSRGAVDMRLIPGRGGLTLPEMLCPHSVDVLWVVGANPLDRHHFAKGDSFLVVQDLFMTTTAAGADVVLPAASAYEKSGTMTNVCGEVQRLRRALRRPGTKTDAEIAGLIARAMSVPFGATDADSLFEEIRTAIPGYAVPRSTILAGGACATHPADVSLTFDWNPELVRSRGDTQFTSGTLGRYCPTLSAVMEGPSGLYRWPEY